MNDAVSRQIREVIESHRSLTVRLLADVEIIAAAAELVSRVLKTNGRVYVCGNGGSAADAQHIAAELVGRFELERRALPAVSLSSNSSTVTSVSNDYGYERVFARQVEALVEAKDLLWVISTSGSSANVVAAAEAAQKKGAAVLAFTGRKGGKLESLAELCLCAGSDSTARSQEMHQLAYHIICKLVEQDFAGAIDD